MSPTGPPHKPLLLYYILCALGLISTANAEVTTMSNNTVSQSLRRTLPEHEWVGKTNLNYTDLYNNYEEALSCLSMPIGVLGHYWWFTMLLVNQLEIFKALGKIDNGSLSGRACMTLLLGGILGIGWNVFSVIYGIKTLKRCSESAGFSALRGITILTNISNGLGGLGGVASGIMGAAGGHWMWAAYLNMGCSLVAMCLLCAEGMVLFITFGKDAGILGELMKNPDKVRLDMTLAAILPSGIVFLAWMIVLVSGNSRWGIGIVTPVAIVSIISIVMSGFGNLLLGKIQGDPSGSLVLDSKLGTTYVVLTGVLPFLEGGLVFLGID